MGLAANVMVLLPISRAEDPRLTGVPDIVTPGSPGDRLMLMMAKPAGLAVKV